VQSGIAHLPVKTYSRINQLDRVFFVRLEVVLLVELHFDQFFMPTPHKPYNNNIKV